MAYIVRRQSRLLPEPPIAQASVPEPSHLAYVPELAERQTALFLASSLAQQVHNHLNEHPLADLQTLRGVVLEWRDLPTHAPSNARSTESTKPSTVKTTADGPTLATLSKLYIEEGKRGGTWRTVSTFEVERALRDLFELMGDMPVEAFDATASPTAERTVEPMPAILRPTP